MASPRQESVTIDQLRARKAQAESYIATYVEKVMRDFESDTGVVAVGVEIDFTEQLRPGHRQIVGAVLTGCRLVLAEL